MLRKGEQCSPTDVCHVHDINVRCYVKAWGAQCAPYAPNRIFNTRKISGEIPGSGHPPMLGTAVLRGKPANLAGFFVACLQIDKCTTNSYAVIGAQRMRNIGKGGC